MITRRDLLARGAAALLAGPGARRARRCRSTVCARCATPCAGRVLTPGDAGYDAARVVFNTRWDGVKPPAVVQVRDTADVRAVVRWADRYDVPLVARSGGHGYSGNSTSATAVVVDLDALDRDPLRRRDRDARARARGSGDVYARARAPAA